MGSEYEKFQKGIATADFGDDSLWDGPRNAFNKTLDGRRFADSPPSADWSPGEPARPRRDRRQRRRAPDLFATGFLSRPPSG